jgi:integrating conjugative element protein (TIGR03759 family)
MTFMSKSSPKHPLQVAAAAWLLLVSASVTIAPATTTAQNTPTAGSRIAQSQDHITVDADLNERLARDWGLQVEEWERYRQLMQGPLGMYSPNLDPLSALGIESRTDEERQRYAELQVQSEARRVEKILAYQRAYDEAWKRLHPMLHPVVLTDAGDPLATTDAPGRLAVFVKEDCLTCDQRVAQLQAAGATFDIYVVGSRQDDTRIRQWAANVGIESAKVHAKVITLNHDAGRWLSIGVQGELPAVVREVNGQWQRQ